MSVLFLSHSSSDNSTANEVLAWLKEQGHDAVFVDHAIKGGITGGERWEERLYSELRRCRALLALVSSDWLTSIWCVAEVNQAQALRKMVIPLHIANSGSKAKFAQLYKERAPPVLSGIQPIDWAKRDEAKQRLRAALNEAGLDAKNIFTWQGNRAPYPGLPPFEKEDAPVFFGREREITDLLKLLRESRAADRARFICIQGASGSGKSSLLRAGLLPRLERNEADWIVIPVFRPLISPFGELVDAFSLCAQQPMKVQPATGGEESVVVADWADWIAEAAKQIRRERKRLEATVLISIDQLEEAVNRRRADALELDDRSDVSMRFLLAMRYALAKTDHRLLVIATLRADTIGAFQRHRALLERSIGGDVIRTDFYPLCTMPRASFHEIIEKPAKTAELSFDDGLVGRIVDETAVDDALPLLAFALRELWEKYGKDQRISTEEYNEFEGIEAAVGKRAEETFQSWRKELERSGATDDEIIGRIARFRRLMLVGFADFTSDNRLIRKPMTWDEIPADLISLVKALRDARLLIEREDMIEVAHDALFRRWKLLSDWRNEASDRHLSTLRSVKTAFASWKGKSGDLIPAGRQLDDARGLVASGLLTDDSKLTNFIKRSEDQANWSKRKQLFWLSVGVGVALLGAVVASDQYVKAQRSEQEALAQRDKAETLLGAFMVDNFLGEIGDMGASDLLVRVRIATTKYLENVLPKPSLIRGRALRNEGDIARAEGLLANSLELFGQALQQFESIASNLESLRERARTHDRIGEVLFNQRQFTEALRHFKSAESAWAEVVGNPSGTPDDCLNLAYNRLLAADSTIPMGNAKIALDYVNSAVELALIAQFGHQNTERVCASVVAKSELLVNFRVIETLRDAALFRAYIFTKEEDYLGAFAFATAAKKLNPRSLSALKGYTVALAERAKFETGTPALIDYKDALQELDKLERIAQNNKALQRERAAVKILIGESLINCAKIKNSQCGQEYELTDSQTNLLDAAAEFQDLSTIDTTNRSLLADLGWVTSSYASLLAANGMLADSLAKYDESDKFYDESQIDSKDTDALTAHATVMLDKADVLKSLGQFESAIELSKDAAVIFSNMVSLHPDNPTFLNSLIDARRRRVIGAEEKYHAVEILTDQYWKLVDSKSEPTYAERDTAVHKYNAGKKAFKDKDYGGAVVVFQEAIIAGKSLIILQPAYYQNYDWLRACHAALAIAFEKLAEIDSQNKGSHEIERENSLRAAMLSAQLAAILATPKEMSGMLEKSHNARQDFNIFLVSTKRFDEALASLNEEIRTAEELLQKDRANAVNLYRLGNSRCGLGQVLREGYIEKETDWEQNIRVGMRYIEKASEIDQRNARYSSEIGSWHRYISDQYEVDGHTDRARQERLLALTKFHRALEIDPSNDDAKTGLSELAARGVQ